MSEYKTVQCEAADEFTVKKSRFIGYVRPVKTADEAVAFINEIKSKHWDATHNVYAYVLREGQTRRYSDDGEPQGTAGIPVLDVLLKEELTDVCVVATRYFGGIMLGAGGLVRAYSHTAKIAVDAGKIITMALCKIATVTCDYTFYGKLTPLIVQAGGIIENTDYADSVTVTFRIHEASYEKLRYDIVDKSNGRFYSEVIDEKFSQI